jgi:hypothetical protein
MRRKTKGPWGTDLGYKFKWAKELGAGDKGIYSKRFQSQVWPGWSLPQSLFWERFQSCYLEGRSSLGLKLETPASNAEEVKVRMLPVKQTA